MKLPECKYKGTEMDLAKLNDGPDIGMEDHGIFVLKASFDYGHVSQGMGYCVDHKFIKKFIEAFGVSWLSECCGNIFVEHSPGGILRLIPVFDAKGVEFDIAEFTKHKGYELR